MSDVLHDPRPDHDGPGPLWHGEDEALARWNRATARIRAEAQTGDPQRIRDAMCVRQEWSAGEYR
jgi:hypothetical protein